MSRDQLTEPQADQDVDAQRAAPEREDPVLQGMPPGLRQQVVTIHPGDAQALADLVKIYRGLYDRQILILAARTPHLGNSVVQRAIELSQHRRVQDTAPGLLGDQVHKGGEFDLDASGPATRASAPAPAGTASAQTAPALRPAEVHRGGEFDPYGDERPQRAVAPVATAADVAAAARAAEPAWVAGARTYNAAHAPLVAEFNQLTDRACADASGEIDPQKVASWQAERALLVDGKIGPQTVGSAKAGKAQPPAQGAIASKPEAEGGAAAADAMFERARTHNAAHTELVEQFNDLTDYLCLDDRNQLDPRAVARWQMHHGEPADGMVIPETVAAAKAQKEARA